MPHLTDLTGLFGIASVLAALAIQLPRIKTLPKNKLAVFLSVLFALLLIPFGDIPLAGYVRGMSGDLSITSVVLAWLTLSQPFHVTHDEKNRVHLLTLIAVTAVIFYPMTLGVSLIDPYRLGYSDTVFVTIVLVTAAAAWFKRSGLIVCCLALAVIAWSLGWYESTNLWDYLLDPLVSIYALAALTLCGLGRRRGFVNAAKKHRPEQ